MTPQQPENAASERQSPRISVVIVSFYRLENLRDSLRMLGSDHQIVVVDSGTPGIADLGPEFPHVRWSRLPKNFGLTKALNIGVRATDGEFILFLHDDVRITADAVTRLADYIDAHSDAAAVCPLLTDAEGRPVPQIRALPSPSDPDPALTIPDGGHDSIAECVSGAAVMFRSFYLRALRHIDERYGNYGSAIELSQQVRKSGKKIVILHDVTAVHEGLPSPMPASALAGDRAAGTAAFLAKHYGFVTGLLYRTKAALAALFTLRFSVLTGALSGQKIDGTG